MLKYSSLKPISEKGIDLFSEEYERVDNYQDADAILVRSASMHDLELSD